MERSGADAAPPIMPDMNGEPTHGPTDETDPDTGALRGADSAGHRLTAGLTVGSRVVVRYRLDEGAGAGATDFLGELVARNDDFLIVDTKSERVKLIRATSSPRRTCRRPRAARVEPTSASRRTTSRSSWPRGGLPSTAPASATGSCARPAASPVARTPFSRWETPACRSTRPSTMPRSGTPIATAPRSSSCTASAASPSRSSRWPRPSSSAATPWAVTTTAGSACSS